MENKLGRTLLAIAIGGVAVWIIFKALVTPKKEIIVAPQKPAELEQPKWQITAGQVCYRSGNAYVCIPNPIGGLFKREDQLSLETIQVNAQTSIR